MAIAKFPSRAMLVLVVGWGVQLSMASTTEHHPLMLPEALAGLHPRFIRENLASAWDKSSLQRLDSRIDPGVELLSATPSLDDSTGRKFQESWLPKPADLFRVLPPHTHTIRTPCDHQLLYCTPLY